MIRAEINLFLLALQFLTRFPISVKTTYSTENQAASVRYYPAIGLCIGVFAASIYWLAHMLFATLPALILSTMATLLLTGAFHEDGLVDTFDGIGGGVITKDRTLDIMKDSRIGTYGASALVLVLMLKISALASLTPPLIVLALITGHGLSRLSCVIVILTSTYVRDQGTGKSVSNGMSRTGYSIALATGLLCFIILAYFATPIVALFTFAGLAIGHIAIRMLFEHKLGGYTGDTLGAVQQVSEVGVYLGLCAWV
ncbi:MAG: adenosylcobinamide-GDP ribazoletransferase [Robiginitomaculum sp.]